MDHDKEVQQILKDVLSAPQLLAAYQVFAINVEGSMTTDFDTTVFRLLDYLDDKTDEAIYISFIVGQALTILTALSIHAPLISLLIIIYDYLFWNTLIDGMATLLSGINTAIHLKNKKNRQQYAHHKIIINNLAALILAASSIAAFFSLVPGILPAWAFALCTYTTLKHIQDELILAGKKSDDPLFLLTDRLTKLHAQSEKNNKLKAEIQRDISKDQRSQEDNYQLMKKILLFHQQEVSINYLKKQSLALHRKHRLTLAIHYHHNKNRKIHLLEENLLRNNVLSKAELLEPTSEADRNICQVIQQKQALKYQKLLMKNTIATIAHLSMFSIALSLSFLLLASTLSIIAPPLGLMALFAGIFCQGVAISTGVTASFLMIEKIVENRIITPLAKKKKLQQMQQDLTANCKNTANWALAAEILKKIQYPQPNTLQQKLFIILEFSQDIDNTMLEKALYYYQQDKQKQQKFIEKLSDKVLTKKLLEDPASHRAEIDITAISKKHQKMLVNMQCREEFDVINNCRDNINLFFHHQAQRLQENFQRKNDHELHSELLYSSQLT